MRHAVKLWLCSLLLTAGCLERKLEPLSPCLVSAVVDHRQVDRIDKVDLLFIARQLGVDEGRAGQAAQGAVPEP